MSMKSAVNPALKAAILTLLSSGVQYSNYAILIRMPLSLGFPSLRKIQEATQKLAAQGLISKAVYYGTFYSKATTAQTAAAGV